MKSGTIYKNKIFLARLKENLGMENILSKALLENNSANFFNLGQGKIHRK